MDRAQQLVSITTSETIASVAELIDLEERLRVDTCASGDAPIKWAFRGQPQPYGTLVPSFQRQFTRQSAATAQLIEGRLVDEFRKHYLTLKDRSVDMPNPRRISRGYDLRCLSVMQHYEIPTRLLDWTSDYWTAVYFACASDQSSEAELWYYDRRLFDRQYEGDPALRSLLDPSSTPPKEPTLLSRRGDQMLVELDPQITPRMKKQFAHHTVSADVFADHAPLMFDLQAQALPNVGNPRLLFRVIIKASCKSKALQYLADHKRITASTVFPDVVGLGRFLRWQFESLRTMLL